MFPSIQTFVILLPDYLFTFNISSNHLEYVNDDYSKYCLKHNFVVQTNKLNVSSVFFLSKGRVRLWLHISCQYRSLRNEGILLRIEYNTHNENIFA